MILCVNANAAIDKTVVVPNFRLNEIQRPQKVIALPGGKGCNVARALKCLGEQPVVTGWVGGSAGQFIEDGLRHEGIASAFVHTDCESRTCLSILDPENDTLTELYENGESVLSDKVVEFVEWFEHTIGKYSAVTFSGSLPPGVPADFYAQLIRIANDARVPTLLDSSGDALRQGVVAKPTLVKSNKTEFEELVGMELETIEECVKEAVAISNQYETQIVISLGADGAACVKGDQVIRAQPPRVNVVSAVGSGDSLLAGFALGFARSLSIEDSIKWGVAAGTANAITVGAGVFTENDFHHVFSGTTISKSETKF